MGIVFMSIYLLEVTCYFSSFLIVIFMKGVMLLDYKEVARKVVCCSALYFVSFRHDYCRFVKQHASTKRGTFIFLRVIYFAKWAGHKY